jgi:hypothetical protein
MSDAVLKALPSIKTKSDIPVSTARDKFDYPLRESFPVSADQAEKDLVIAKAMLSYYEGKPEYAGTRTLDNARVQVFSANQKLNTAKKFSGENSIPKTKQLEQYSVRIGDAVFVTFPGELFSEIGLRIKNGSPYQKTFILGLAAGGGGYLPAAREFIDGDYEVDGSDYGPSTEDACVRFSLDMIGRVTR